MKKILIVDDHRLFLDGIRYLLQQLDDRPEIDTCSHVREAIGRLDNGERYTLALVDLELPDMDGFKFMQALRERRINCPVVLVSATTASSDIRRALKLGALGFIPKYAPGDVMLAGIRKVLDGDVFLPDEIWQQLGDRPLHGDELRTPDIQDTDLPGLGSRQYQVLELMAEGMTNKQIAAVLAISEATVKYHIGILFRALGVNSRTACIRKAQNDKLIPGGTL